jgi:hypothetical protein
MDNDNDIVYDPIDEIELEYVDIPGFKRRACQFCKQIRNCRYIEDPFLLHNFDEIEMVWLCQKCLTVRQDGEHLPEVAEGVML